MSYPYYPGDDPFCQLPPDLPSDPDPSVPDPPAPSDDHGNCDSKVSASGSDSNDSTDDDREPIFFDC